VRTPANLPTASRLQLATACPASQVLPVVDTAWGAGDKGTERHAALANVIVGTEQNPPAEVVAWLDALNDEPATLAPLRGAAPELAYGYTPATGVARLIGSNVGRAYNAAPGEFVGSADYVLVADNAVTVVDLKTGLGEVPHPSRNAQLRFLALAAARWHGVESARVGILHAPDGRAAWWSWATVDAFELEAIAVELRTLAERIGYARNDVERGRTPRLTVGEHCTYCPARFGCPARVAMAQRLAGEPEKVVLDLKAMLTPESASLALARWQAATKALAEVGAALHAYASESPIALGDGRAWGPVTSEREVIDADKAWPVLVAKFGANAAREAMSLDTSKAGIERMARALRDTLANKTTIKALTTEALEALRAAGAVTTKKQTWFEEHVIALAEGKAA
jgi:hypothetical protein